MITFRYNRVENLLTNRGIAFVIGLMASVPIYFRRKRLRRIFQELRKHKLGDPFFFQLQVETCSFCNFNCAFCPASRDVDIRPKQFMDLSVLNHLISQLRDIEFNGLISLFNNNEPMIDKRLPEIISLFKRGLPDAKIEIYTNGSLLTLAKAINFWDHGLDSLVVDYYYTKAPDDKRIEAFIKEYRESEDGCLGPITINYLKKDIIRSNRGGRAPNKGKIQKENKGGFCPYPFMQLNVNCKGDVSLCCNDVYYENVVGNLLEEHIGEIWRGDKLQAVREMLLRQERNHGICKNCDNQRLFLESKEILVQKNTNQLMIDGGINNSVGLPIKGPTDSYRI